MITEPHSSDTLGKKQTKHLTTHYQASSLEHPLVKYPGAAQQCMGVIKTASPTCLFPEVSAFNMFAMCLKKKKKFASEQPEVFSNTDALW